MKKPTTDHLVILAYCRYYVATEEFDRRLPGTVVRSRQGRVGDESMIDPLFMSQSNAYAREQRKSLQRELDTFDISASQLFNLKDYVLHLGYERQREYLWKYGYEVPTATEQLEYNAWSPYPMGRIEREREPYVWEGRGRRLSIWPTGHQTIEDVK